MPNHIKNRLRIIGTNEQIKEVFDKYNTHIEAKLFFAYDGSIICKDKNSENFTVGWFNPNTGIFKTREENSERIGIPENWSFEVSTAVDCFPDFDKIIPSPRCDEYNDIPTQQAVRNSPNWWMTWNRKNWGTKWNGYEYQTEIFGTYLFDTAWNGVPDLMLELSKQTPDIEFEYTYADEDTGCNVGKFTFKNGQVISSFLPGNCSKEAYDLSFELRPYNKEYYQLINDQYEYIDDED